MARETKVGLLIALGVILLIGVILSDHLAVTQPQEAQARQTAAVAEFAPAAQQGIQPGRQTTAQPTTKPADSVRGLPEAAPRLIAPDRFAEPTLGPPARQQPDIQAADARTLLADLPSPPTAWRKAPTILHDETAQPADPARDLPATRLSGNNADADADAALAPLPVRQAGSEFLHDVQPGDTLASLALKFYDDSAYADSLLAANPGSLNADGSLTPGSRLIVPNRAGHIDQPNPKPALATAIADEPPTALMSTGLFVPVTGTLDPITALAEIQAEQREAHSQTITVQPGDSLSKLAERHLGSQTRFLELFEANRDVLDSPDKVVVGMQLKLPPGSANIASSKTTDTVRGSNPAAPPARPAAPTYTVKPGDSLSRIAQATLGSRDRWKQLYEANRDRLASPDTVKVGQELRIPN